MSIYVRSTWNIDDAQIHDNNLGTVRYNDEHSSDNTRLTETGKRVASLPS